MGATTRDIFGRPEDAEPATPGSYGETPRGFRLPTETRLGRVRLQVADLRRSLAFYQGVLGFRTVQQEPSRAVLAAQKDDASLVELHEHPGARPAPRRGALGLYHFAILLPDRPSLGRIVRHLGELGVRVGQADHLVSESLYIQDPDNLGIEVYADRPRRMWRRLDRELMMATDPLDIAGLLDAAADTRWSGMPHGTTIGHVHLHVGDIGEGNNFYSDAIGFDRTVWHYPGALFLAAGGYHHHLGINTWAGAGAQPPAQTDARLLEWTIEVPEPAAVSAARDSLMQGGFVAEQPDDAKDGSELITRDPWGTQLRITLPARSRRTARPSI